MTKLIIALVIVVVLSVGAIYMAPAVIFTMMPDCTSQTTFITVDKNKTIVSRGQWYLQTFTEKSLGSYHGQLLYYEAGTTKIRNVSFSFETENRIIGRAIRTTTRSFATNFDNTASHDEIVRYVDNATKKDHVGFHKIIVINRAFYASGLPNGLPRGVCNQIQ